MMTATIATHHSISFFRNTRTNEVSASCSCGWTATGEAAKIHSAAACHDLDIPEGKQATDNVDWDAMAEKRLGQS